MEFDINDDVFQVIIAHNESESVYELEVDGQITNVFNTLEEANKHKDMLLYVYSVGYQKERAHREITNADTLYDWELPDSFKYKGNY